MSWVVPRESSSRWLDEVPAARLVTAPCSSGERCRCGTRPRLGTPVWLLVDLPGPLTSKFEGRLFCCLGCVRAEFLESLEFMESAPARRPGGDPETLRVGYSRLYSHLQNEMLRQAYSRGSS
jgi:hypothetical protein